MNKTLTLAVLLGSLSLPALAQSSATPGIDQRQANQAQRIDQGEASGALTPREARRLERRQGHIERMETRAKADGVVTGQERAHLRHAERAESRRILRQKHDAQHDYNHNGRADRPGRR